MYNSDQHWIKLVIEGNKTGGVNLVFASRFPDQAAQVERKTVIYFSTSMDHKCRCVYKQIDVCVQQIPSGHNGYLRLRLEISSDGKEVAALYEHHECLFLIGRMSIASCPRLLTL